mgnify:CR=1 FL=1
MSSRAPVVVAEVSANHQGSLRKALALVEAVAQTGVSSIKFQTYTADTMTIDIDAPQFRIDDDHGLWGGRSLYSLYEQAHTPWEWHAELFAESRRLGLTPFSSPFDPSAVEFLETLEPALYKVASLEIGDIQLIRRIAQTGRPMVMSTGTATLDELDDAVSTAQDTGCEDLTLLLCTSAYPASAVDAHLARMATLRERYGLPVGLSDHSKGNVVSIAAVALGAVMIERHVTMNRAEGGPDAAFSLEPDELRRLVVDVGNCHHAVGSSRWRTVDAEDTSRQLKRSLYITADCAPGDILTPHNVRSIRPSGGLAPKYYDQVLGRRLVVAAPRGTPLSLDMLDFEVP